MWEKAPSRYNEFSQILTKEHVICRLHISHNTACFPPKTFINIVFSFLLRLKYPGEKKKKRKKKLCKMLSGKQGIINGRCANNQFRETSHYSLFHDSLRVIEEQKMSEIEFWTCTTKVNFGHIGRFLNTDNRNSMNAKTNNFHGLFDLFIFRNTVNQTHRQLWIKTKGAYIR